MKLLSLFLLIFCLLAFSDTRYGQYYQKRNIGIGSVTLAMILKKLGANSSVYQLANRIEYQCGSKRLVRSWVRIALRFRKAIKLSTIFPFTLRRFWYIFHKHRVVVILLFLKTFIRCGRVLGAQKALKKILLAYYITKSLNKKTILKVIQRIKRVFLRRRKISNNQDNGSIYPTPLLRKMGILRRLLIKFVKSRRKCAFNEKYCQNTRALYKRVKALRRKINPKMHDIFQRYFSSLFGFFIHNNSKRKYRIIIVRRYPKFQKKYSKLKNYYNNNNFNSNDSDEEDSEDSGNNDDNEDNLQSEEFEYN